MPITNAAHKKGLYVKLPGPTIEAIKRLGLVYGGQGNVVMLAVFALDAILGRSMSDIEIHDGKIYGETEGRAVVGYLLNNLSVNQANLESAKLEMEKPDLNPS